MATISRFERWSPRLTQATGVLLVLLGVIHLVATPFYIGWASRSVSPDSAHLVVAAMKLNHILTGILLVPLGISTFWAGKALHETWALRLAAFNAVIVLSFPVLLVATVRSLDAPLFRLAIVVLALACLTQIAALAGVWALRRRKPA